MTEQWYDSEDLRVTQIGVEALGAGGTPVPAMTRLSSTSFSLTPGGDISTSGPVGSLFDTSASLDTEHAEIAMEGVPDYNDLIFPFATIITEPTTTTPAGATLTRDHEFIFPTSGRGRGRSLTVEQGEVGGRAERTSYAMLAAMSATFARESAGSIDGSGMGKPLDWNARMAGNEIQRVVVSATGGTFRLTFNGQQTAPIAYNATVAAVQLALEALSNIDVGEVVVSGAPSAYDVEFTGRYAQTNVAQMTSDATALTGGALTATVTTTTGGAAPTTLAVAQLQPGQGDLYADPTGVITAFASLPKIEVSALAFGWSIGDRRAVVRAINSAKAGGFTGWVITRPDPTFTVTLANDSVGRAYIDQMKATKLVRMRYQAIGPEIETGFNYRYQCDLAGRISAMPDRGEISRASTLAFSLRMMPDPLTGQACIQRLRNIVPAFV